MHIDGPGKPDQERRYTACVLSVIAKLWSAGSQARPGVGFTLIELLIVIIVLGILAAIVVFSLTGVTGQSKAAACTTDAKSVEIAAAAYQANDRYTWPGQPLAWQDWCRSYLHSAPLTHQRLHHHHRRRPTCQVDVTTAADTDRAYDATGCPGSLVVAD